MSHPPAGATRHRPQEFTESPPSRKKRIPWTFIVIGVVVAAIAVPFAYLLLTDPDVGDCVAPKKTSDNTLTFKVVKCTTPEAVHKVVDDSGNSKTDCAPGDYVVTHRSVRSKGGKRSRGTGRSNIPTCYVLNVREGDCLKGHKYRKPAEPIAHRVPCAGAESKVVKIHDGRFDKSLCQDKVLSRAYSKPARTVCLAKP